MGIDGRPGDSGLMRVRNADGEFEACLQVRPVRDACVLEREAILILPSPVYGRMSPVSFFANEKIAPMMLRMIDNARAEIKLMAYQMDHEAGMRSLARVAQEKRITLKVLIDKRCFDEPSRGPARQAERLKRMMEQAGPTLELRKLTPSTQRRVGTTRCTQNYGSSITRSWSRVRRTSRVRARKI